MPKKISDLTPDTSIADTDLFEVSVDNGVGGYNSRSTTRKSLENSLNPDYLNIGTGALQPSALLQLNSTTQGLLLCRLTTTERDAIATPLAGLVIYNRTTNRINYYNGTTWIIV